MTPGNPGRPAPAEAPHSAPVARVSRSALAANLERVIARGNRVIDVRADAWGHGVREVADAALTAGAERLLVDDHGASLLAGRVDPTALRQDAAAAAADPGEVFGFAAGSRPVLSLHGFVLSTKVLLSGEGVSYGYTHRAEHDTTAALVTGGYAQGIVRSLGNAASVTIGGERAPIVGRVAMDVCVIDIGDRDVDRGDAVVFFGDPALGEPAVEEWARITGMTPGELVTAVGARAIREYVA